MLDSLQSQMRPDQVVLIVGPPHLIDKWQREIESLSRTQSLNDQSRADGARYRQNRPSQARYDQTRCGP